MNRSSDALPPNVSVFRRRGQLPPDGSSWWLAPHQVSHRCRYCGEVGMDYPCVMRYIASLDYCDESAWRYPGWREKGWLAWWECPSCGEDHSRTWEALTDDQVLAFGVRRGEWRPR